MSRNFLLVLLFVPLLLASCAASGETGRRTGKEQKFRVQHDVIFSPTGWPREVKGDLYVPETTARRPAVLVIHGGSWTTRDKRWYMTPIAKSLARRGYVALNATYRGAPAWHYPAPVQDLREAIKWLRRHAEEYHIQPDRIGVFGYSAGAQLAAQLGALDGPQSVRVQAVVAGGCPADMRFFPRGKLVPAYLGGTPAAVPQVFREASPVTHITSDDPPFFVYHGERDRIVPPEHAVALKKALERAGVPHEFVWVKNRGHIATFLFGGEVVRKAIDFLDRTLKRS